MSNVLDKRHIADLKPEAVNMALDMVLDVLVEHMKPKARAAAKARLERAASAAETHTRAAKVVHIRAPHIGSYADVQRAARADAIRFLIGRAF